jgi:hypothetical protein
MVLLSESTVRVPILYRLEDGQLSGWCRILGTHLLRVGKPVRIDGFVMLVRTDPDAVDWFALVAENVLAFAVSVDDSRNAVGKAK